MASIAFFVLSLWLMKNKILTWIFQSDNGSNISFTPAPNTPDAVCVLTSESGEGPFYFKSPFRRDVREGKAGENLDLKLQILSHPDCQPLKDVIVEIWQCDAHGVYSGYPDLEDSAWEFVKLIEFGKKTKGVEPQNEKVFLRGAQITDQNGVVDFTTIMPSWYTPRLPHIHFKVRTNDTDYISSELHFEDEFCNDLFISKAPYDQRGKSPYHHKSDKIITQFPDGQGLVLSPEKNNLGRFTAFAKIGIE